MVLALRSLGEAVVEIFKNGRNLFYDETLRLYGLLQFQP